MQLATPLYKLPVKPIYLIYGRDEWQSINAVKKIKAYFGNIKKYCFSNLSEFINFYKINKAELLTKDLFCINSVNKIVEIKIGNAKFTKTQGSELSDFFNKIHKLSNVVVIMVAEKLDKITINSSWVQFINKIGVIIFTRPFSKVLMQSWVKEQFNKLSLSIDQDALDKFSDLYQNNLMAAEQSIYKISLILSDAKSISKNFCIDLNFLSNHFDTLEEEQKFTVFDLQTAIINKNKKELLLVLKNLKQQCEENLLIMWSITQEIKNLLNRLICKGKNNNEIAKLNLLLQKSAAIDLAIKGVGDLNELLIKKNINNNSYIWVLILDLCLNFIQ